MILKHIKALEKNSTSQGHDYTAGCLLDYPYFKENYKMIVIDLSIKLLMLILEQFNNLILLEI